MRKNELFSTDKIVRLTYFFYFCTTKGLSKDETRNYDPPHFFCGGRQDT